MKLEGSSPRVQFRPQIAVAADRVRRGLSRVDDAEVRKARRLARRSRAGGLDVVYFGDSLTSFVAPYDDDRRPIHRMIRDALGPSISMHVTHGGSYSAPLYSAFLRLIESSPARPVIVVPLWVRGRTVPWMQHPVHGRSNAIDFLSRLDPEAPLWQIRKGFRPATAADWEAFHALPHHTWAGDWVIGDYVERLKGGGERDDEWVKLLYAYHHGGRVPPGRALDQVAMLGEHLRRLQLPVVAYQTPVPVVKGEEFYPEFRALAEKNLDEMQEAFVAGYAREDAVLRTGTSASTDEFIDWRDGSEHLNEVGRRRLAQAIVDATMVALVR